MENNFWFLPEPLGIALFTALMGFLFLVAPPLIAQAKGFGSRAWMVPSGLLGFLAVILLPSALAPGLTDDERADRVQHGRWVGGAQAVIVVFAITAMSVRVAVESIVGW